MTFAPSFRLLVVVACALAGALGVAACSDRKLVPVEDARVKNYDDRVQLDVEFCTRPAEDTVFPVKVLLVLDGSGSLQFTDQSGRRRVAVRDLMSALGTQQNVYVSTMVFGSNLYVEPAVTGNDPAFIPAREWVEPAFLNTADVQTNYQGALSAAYSHLLYDMLRSDPGELARTKYVILFFSDGVPSPVCCITAEQDQGSLNHPFDCPSEPWEAYDDTLPYCEGQEEVPVCNLDEWLENFRNVNAQDPAATPDYGGDTIQALDGLEAGDNYNRVYQVEDLTSEIMELGETFGVGEIRLHTMLLWDSTLPDAVKEIYRLNRCRAERLMQRMAELGNGVFRDFEGSAEIDFLSFNFTSLKQGYGLVQTLAMNANAVIGPDGELTADSDGDGLPDVVELERGSDPMLRDSDKLARPPLPTEVPTPLPEAQWGDGYGDLVEEQRRNTGYDPRYQSLPVTPCPLFDPAGGGVDRSDLDGDGLNGCEEDLYGTDIDRPDTDGDGLSDFVEVRLGLDPTRPERDHDDDFDGVRNMDEVRRGTNPLEPDGDANGARHVRYELIEGEETEDGRRCYTATARDLRLVTTGPRVPGGRSGYNDLYFWIAEAPLDNPTGRTELRFGCVRAQYIAPSYKDPPQGRVSLREEDLVDLADPEDLARLAAGEDVCVGRRVE